jgi:hypothetical protein
MPSGSGNMPTLYQNRDNRRFQQPYELSSGRHNIQGFSRPIGMTFWENPDDSAATDDIHKTTKRSHIGAKFMIAAHQTFGDMLRWNPHFHCIVLEGGFDQNGKFLYIPFSDLSTMTELFRRRVIQLLVKENCINLGFARNLLSWKHSGFSIDNSVRILDKHSQESLTQYAARPAVSLKKVHYEPTKGRVFFHTHYSDYFKENMKMFDALDFIAELTQHIPPKENPAYSTIWFICFAYPWNLEGASWGYRACS